MQRCGRWTLLTRIKPHKASSKKRSGHICFIEDDLLHAISKSHKTLENFGLLDPQLLLGGGHTWRFDCINIVLLSPENQRRIQVVG